MSKLLPVEGTWDHAIAQTNITASRSPTSERALLQELRAQALKSIYTQAKAQATEHCLKPGEWYLGVWIEKVEHPDGGTLVTYKGQWRRLPGYAEGEGDHR